MVSVDSQTPSIGKVSRVKKKKQLQKKSWIGASPPGVLKFFFRIEIEKY